jgi:hypothetical protein
MEKANGSIGRPVVEDGQNLCHGNHGDPARSTCGALPDGFHRIRHYGFLANGHRAARLAHCRKLLDVPASPLMIAPTDEAAGTLPLDRCPCCGGAMISLATLPQPSPPRARFWRDSS